MNITELTYQADLLYQKFEDAEQNVRDIEERISQETDPDELQGLQEEFDEAEAERDDLDQQVADAYQEIEDLKAAQAVQS